MTPETVSRRQFLIGMLAVGASMCLPTQATVVPITSVALGTASTSPSGYDVPCNPSVLSTLRWRMNEWAASCNTDIQSWVQSIVGSEALACIRQAFSWTTDNESQ